MPPEWEDALGSGCLVLSDMPAERMREVRIFSPWLIALTGDFSVVCTVAAGVVLLTVQSGGQ